MQDDTASLFASRRYLASFDCITRVAVSTKKVAMEGGGFLRVDQWIANCSSTRSYQSLVQRNTCMRKTPTTSDFDRRILMSHSEYLGTVEFFK